MMSPFSHSKKCACGTLDMFVQQCPLLKLFSFPNLQLKKYMSGTHYMLSHSMSSEAGKSIKGQAQVSLPVCMKLHVSVLSGDIEPSIGRITGVRRSIFNSSVCVLSFLCVKARMLFYASHFSLVLFLTYTIFSKQEGNRILVTIYDIFYYLK